MIVFWIIAFILVAAYIIWISLFFSGWINIPEYSPSWSEKVLVSVIIPVRNEQDNIGHLLNDLVQQEYPKDSFEIILIDDHSTDFTSEVISAFTNQEVKVRYIRLGDTQGKKQALYTGVKESKYPVILTTDADCRIGARWIKTMVGCIENSKADLVAGPIILHGDNRFFFKFQQLEMLSLTGSSAGAIKTGNPVMCSAANLCFRKSAYLEARDARYDHVSSGDDVFLLLSLHKTGKYNIVYLKNAESCVSAKAQVSLSGFINQRRRWASKSRYYNTHASVFTALLVFLINMYAVFCLFTGLISSAFLSISFFIFLGKSLIDFPFLFSLTGFFRKRKLLFYFPAIQVLYFFYISFTAVSALTNNFEWKGRILKY